MKRQLKHVIFLGAGASCTSGYPIGQELRLRMASPDHFKAELQKIAPESSSTAAIRECHQKCLKRFKDFEESVELFRHGGFGTVDEFGKLASGGYQKHVQNMKNLLRVVLSLHNPEEEFHKSDYYSFIQRIFRDDKLDELRPDITVLTYNYDCYLDFLILEAFRYRQKLSESPLKIDDLCANKLTSGFFNPTDGRDWASQTQGFNYFKLHGSIAYGNEPYFGHNALFRLNMTERLSYLGNEGLQFEAPPIVFPWELFDGDSGNFISEDDFIFVKEAKAPAGQESARQLFRHFKTIWENAKRAVLKADKISFVGLSMHEYLKDGLTYLFDGFNKAPMPEFQRAIDAGIMKDQPPKQVQVVVANPENEQFKNAENRLHPSSLCGNVADLLKDVAPKMHYVRSSSEYDGIFRSTDTPDKKEDPDITPRYKFEEFIQREMG